MTNALLVTVEPSVVATSWYWPGAETWRFGNVATPPDVNATLPEIVPVPESVWRLRTTLVPSGTATPPDGGVITTWIGLVPSVIGVFFCVSTGWFPNAIAP